MNSVWSRLFHLGVRFSLFSGIGILSLFPRSKVLAEPLSVEPLSLDVTSQIISVSQLSDVQLTDWAFQTLQSLVERYGCIASYPNHAFQIEEHYI